MVQNDFKKFIKLMKQEMGYDFVKQYLRYIKYKNWYDHLLKRKKCPIPTNGISSYWLIFTLDAVTGFTVPWNLFFTKCPYEEIEQFFDKKTLDNYFSMMKYHSPSTFDKIVKNTSYEKSLK